MLKRVAILANGGDVSGFNAVIRAIVKTAENNNIELKDLTCPKVIKVHDIKIKVSQN